MALFRRATLAVPRALSPRQVPTDAMEIDWSHPLARGLVGLYIPGGRSGLTDLCGIGPVLTSHANGTMVASSLGPGLNGNTTNAGASSTVEPTQYEFTNTYMALVHLGMHLSQFATNGDAPLLAINRSSGGAPYYPYNLATFQTTTGIAFEYMGQQAFTSVLPDLGINSLAVTFGTQSGNALAIYKNGASIQSGNMQLTIGYYSDDLLEIGVNTGYNTRYYGGISLAAAIYNTGAAAMPASTVAWLAREPFAMLRPVVRRSYSVPSVVVAAATQARAMVMA